jgi:hypothetical protein
MNNIDLRVLPSKVVFTIWLQQIIQSKRATFSRTYENVIELNSGVCSMFAFGRHSKTNHPVFAAPRPLMPWFLVGQINRMIVTKENRVYIEFGEEGSAFYLGINCSRKRTAVLLPMIEDTQDLVKTIDFHGYITTDDKTVELTKALNRAPLLMVGSFDEIVPPKELDYLSYEDCLVKDFDITDVNNFDKLKDPLNF